ncbi:MAG TPA: BamA/TamA family outer membrane protein, partial [Segetibacter sp.]|nr:BamA/TamA family outer membrane protein [Segetibacter sp.]
DGMKQSKMGAAPVKVRIIHLALEKGGLSVIEKGGGLQTKSLKLKDHNGRLWVLRSIQKYPDKALPESLKKTIAKDILQDQVATGHPFAALTVPPFAEALGIPHSNPEIVYVADDPDLGEFRTEFANSVLLLEERDPLTSIDTDNTEKVLEKLEKNHDNRVDQKMVLRARLLDLFLGDWDRHEGQWRWDEAKQNGGSTYIPIPRDRDKVYYNTGGIFPWLLSHQSLKSNLQGFHDGIRDIGGYNYNNRYFDRLFLNELSENDWNLEISFVQTRLTDNLIENAIGRLPDSIYKLSGKKIISTLIARRAKLKEEALKYFKLLSQKVDIAASDKAERVELQNREDGNVAIRIYAINKQDSANKIVYNRVFDSRHTSDIRLYALGGNDVFSVSGKEKSPIKVRMIGGDGLDKFYVDKDVHNKSKLYVYDRSDQENVFPSTSSARIKASNDSSANTYDKHNFKYDKLGPIITILYTLDQGLLLRAGIGYEKHGFRKEPFAEKHLLSANYATERNSFMLEYSAYLTKVLKNNDVSIDFISRGPRNVSNFFGLGNETDFANTEGKEINYYRNRFDVVSADIKLVRPLTKSITVNAGLAGQYYTSAQANNFTHFFQNYNELRPDDNVFSHRYYAGLVVGSSIDTRNNGLFSSKGIFWETEVSAMRELAGNKTSFGKVVSELNFYIPLLKDSNIVIANRVGGGTTIGSPMFFQSMQLGGIRNLRGFHTYRFTGKTMFYHNLDVRCKLFDFNSYLFPGTVGVVGFNDVGRVWLPGEASNKWHHGYGGGIYIIPADLLLVQALVGHSVEGTMPYISVGFTF